MTLMRKGLNFQATITHSLDSEFIAGIKSTVDTIFCDMGSGQIDGLERLSKRLGKHITIFDHHTVLRDSDIVTQVNTHLAGIDGTYECSASTLLFLFSTWLDETNWNLIDLALAGTVGDKQHLSGLKGQNRMVADEGLRRGFVETSRDIDLEDGSLFSVLTETCDPFLRDVSGRENEVKKMLHRFKLPWDKNLSELSSEEKRAFTSMLVLKLLRQGVRKEAIEEIVTERFWLKQRGMSANTLSNYINALGRMERTADGLALCFGSPGALETAKQTRIEYRKLVRVGLLKLEKEGCGKLKSLLYFYSPDPSIAGAHAALCLTYLTDSERPIIALSQLDKITRVSARGNSHLVGKGLDLASGCSLASQPLDGYGGGHRIAAGATIPRGKEMEFLNALDEIVEKQLKG